MLCGTGGGVLCGTEGGVLCGTGGGVLCGTNSFGVAAMHRFPTDVWVTSTRTDPGNTSDAKFSASLPFRDFEFCCSTTLKMLKRSVWLNFQDELNETLCSTKYSG